jgi:hypothetical protein
MQMKISYIISLLAGILAAVSVFLTYASTKVIGYDAGINYNGFDLRDLLKDIGGDWMNGLAEYAVIFIFIFGIFSVVYSIVLCINSSKLKNVPLDFIINGVILIILAVVIIVRIGQIEYLGVSYSIGFGVYIALIAGILNIVAGVLEYRDSGKLLSNRFQTAGDSPPLPFFIRNPIRVRMRPFSERTKFMPGDSFEEDMRRLAGEVRGECEYIPTELDHPDYRILSEGQRDYYFYWRSELAKGNLLVNDEGLMWLRMCEIVNLGIDPMQGYRELKLMLDRGGYKRVRDTVTSTLVDWCIAHSLPIPPIWIWGWDKRHDVILTSAMSPAPDRLPLEFIKREGQVDDVYYDMNTDMLEDVCNAAIQALDRHLIMMTGRGLLETYSRRDATMHTVYDGLVCFSEERSYRISYLKPTAEFRTMMKSIVRYGEKLLFKKIGINGPNCPGAFKNEYRRIADAAAEAVEKEGYIQLPKSELLYSAVPVSRRERMLIEMGEQLEESDGGKVLEDLTAKAMAVRPGFESELRELSARIQPYPKQYVPSGATNLVPDQASDDALDYYLFWRDEAKNGTFHDTDRGYLWLYLCELINSDEDPRKVLDALAEMAMAYEHDDENERPFIGPVYLDYALANGIRSVDPGVFRSNLSMNLALDSVFSDEPMLDIGTVSKASGLKTETALRGFDETCLRALMMALRELDSTTPFYLRCRLRSNMYTDRAFKRLRYYGDLPREISVEYLDYLGSESFCDGLRDLARCVLQTVAKARGGKGKVKVDRAFGQTVAKIAEKCAQAAIATQDRASKRRIEIDPEKLKKAESDLDEVTGMMGVEETRDEEPEEMPAAPAEEGWSAFAASLTPDEKDYIRSVLAGAPSASGGRAIRLEDSINGKAMDAVGDAVVEDGEAIDDYIEQLEETIG